MAAPLDVTYTPDAAPLPSWLSYASTPTLTETVSYTYATLVSGTPTLLASQIVVTRVRTDVVQLQLTVDVPEGISLDFPYTTSGGTDAPQGSVLGGTGAVFNLMSQYTMPAVGATETSANAGQGGATITRQGESNGIATNTAAPSGATGLASPTIAPSNSNLNTLSQNTATGSPIGASSITGASIATSNANGPQATSNALVPSNTATSPDSAADTIPSPAQLSTLTLPNGALTTSTASGTATATATPVSLSTLPNGSVSTVPPTSPSEIISTLPNGSLTTSTSIPTSPAGQATTSTLPNGSLTTISPLSSLPTASTSTLPNGSLTTIPLASSTQVSTLPNGSLTTFTSAVPALAQRTTSHLSKSQVAGISVGVILFSLLLLFCCLALCLRRRNRRRRNPPPTGIWSGAQNTGTSGTQYGTAPRSAFSGTEAAWGTALAAMLGRGRGGTREENRTLNRGENEEEEEALEEGAATAGPAGMRERPKSSSSLLYSLARPAPSHQYRDQEAGTLLQTPPNEYEEDDMNTYRTNRQGLEDALGATGILSTIAAERWAQDGYSSPGTPRAGPSGGRFREESGESNLTSVQNSPAMSGSPKRKRKFYTPAVTEMGWMTKRGKEKEEGNTTTSSGSTRTSSGTDSYGSSAGSRGGRGGGPGDSGAGAGGNGSWNGGGRGGTPSAGSADASPNMSELFYTTPRWLGSRRKEGPSEPAIAEESPASRYSNSPSAFPYASTSSPPFRFNDTQTTPIKPSPDTFDSDMPDTPPSLPPLAISNRGSSLRYSGILAGLGLNVKRSHEALSQDDEEDRYTQAPHVKQHRRPSSITSGTPSLEAAERMRGGSLEVTMDDLPPSPTQQRKVYDRRQIARTSFGTLGQHIQQREERSPNSDSGGSYGHSSRDHSGSNSGSSGAHSWGSRGGHNYLERSMNAKRNTLGRHPTGSSDGSSQAMRSEPSSGSSRVALSTGRS